MAESFEVRSKIAKVDETLGLVMGFGIICKENGKDYFDLQGDHVPEESMLKAALDFMVNARVVREMHKGGQVGSVVFAWPMTADIAKAFNIETKRTGLMIAIKPDKKMFKRFLSGELTGFSIGGRRGEDEDVTDD